MKQLLTLALGLCSTIPAAAALSQFCTAPRIQWSPAVMGATTLAVASIPLFAMSREVYRNKDDIRRMRLTKEKVQHVERAIRYADYGDGYARLEQLDLYDAGAKLVADLIVEQYPDLVELELDDNKISDVSAESLGAAIQASTELRTLHLDGNDLTGDAVKHLLQPLCGSKIRHLHFNDNMLGDDGAAALAPLLECSKTLRVLNLKRNQIGDAGARALLEGVQKGTSPFLQRIRLHGNLGSEDETEDATEAEWQDKIDRAIDDRFQTLTQAKTTTKHEPDGASPVKHTGEL